MPSTLVTAAIDRAVTRLRELQRPDGTWPSVVSRDARLRTAKPDDTITTTAWCVCALAGMPDPRLRDLLDRAVAALLRHRRENGLWRYWTGTQAADIDPDADDTSLCAFAVRAVRPEVDLSDLRDAFLAHRDDRGRFYTWFRQPSYRNDIDAVVNVNILRWFGDDVAVVAAVNEIVELAGADEPTLRAASPYYRDAVTFFYAAARALQAGVRGLAAVSMRARHVLEPRLAIPQLFHSPHRTAQAITAALAFGIGAPELLDAAVARLLRDQQAHGGWPAETAWLGPEPPAPPSLYWGSEALTTTLCIEVLANSLDSHARR